MFQILKKITELKVKFRKLKFVGSDMYGNRYYINEKTEQRLCIYNGIAEPSKIPPEWHVWMHHSSDAPITHDDSSSLSWRIGHIPNTTGTKFAYKPKGSVALAIESGEFKLEKNYTSWSPKKIN